MVITHDLKMIKRTMPFESVKQLVITLLDISESDSREPFRHFDIHMVQEELDKFWSELKKYDKLIAPAEAGKEVSYPLDMVSVNGITITLHRYESK